MCLCVITKAALQSNKHRWEKACVCHCNTLVCYCNTLVCHCNTFLCHCSTFVCHLCHCNTFLSHCNTLVCHCNTFVGLAKTIHTYVYTVHIRYFSQEHYHAYGHIWCTYTVQANPKYLRPCKGSKIPEPAWNQCTVQYMSDAF